MKMVDDGDDDESETSGQHQHRSLQLRYSHRLRRHQHDPRSRPTNTPVVLRHFWDKYQKDLVHADRRRQQSNLLAHDVNHKTQTDDPSSVCFSERRSDAELQRVLLTTNLIISVSRFSSMWIFSSSVTVNWISSGCGRNETSEDDIFNLFLIFFLQTNHRKQINQIVKKIIRLDILDWEDVSLLFTTLCDVCKSKTEMITPVTLMHLLETTPKSKLHYSCFVVVSKHVLFFC